MKKRKKKLGSFVPLGRPLLSSLAFTALRSSAKIAYAYFLYDKKNAHNGIYKAAGISGATSHSDRRHGTDKLSGKCGARAGCANANGVGWTLAACYNTEIFGFASQCCASCD